MMATEATLKQDCSLERIRAAAAVGLVLVVVGGSIFNILPLLTSGVVDKLGFTVRRAGEMSLVLTVASGFGAIIAGGWVRSLRWPIAAYIAVGGMLGSILVALAAQRYWIFVLMQGSAAFFATSAGSLATTILSDHPESTRLFGIAMSAQAAYQIGALLAGPSLLQFAGLEGVLVMLAVPAACAIALIPLLPRHGRAVTVARSPYGLLYPPTLLAFAGFTAIFIGAGAYWTYVELMGEAQGITTRLVANSVAIAVAMGIPAGLLAWAQGARFGNVAPIGLAAVLMLIAAALLSGSHGVSSFALAGALYLFALSYAGPYALALVNAVDQTGRGVAVTGAFIYFGSSAGAGLAALFVRPDDYRPVTWIAAIATCVATIVFVLSAALHRRSSARVC